jgi:hypothetical protein
MDTSEDLELEAHMLRAAALVGLEIAPAYRAGVLLNLRRTAEIAALVAGFPLPDDAESAPTFRP